MAPAPDIGTRLEAMETLRALLSYAHHQMQSLNMQICAGIVAIALVALRLRRRCDLAASVRRPNSPH